VVPKSENDESLLSQPFVTFSITRLNVAVLPTVDFYRDSLLQADEIHDVWAYWSLPTKSVAVDLPQSEMLP
jgi:hypothetical protein